MDLNDWLLGIFFLFMAAGTLGIIFLAMRNDGILKNIRLY